MNNNTKTMTYIVVAFVVGLVAFVSRPTSPGTQPEKDLGAKLYPDFEDPLAVRSLEIIKYDSDAFKISSFNLSQVDNVWSISSHENYPADAKDQMVDAASSVMDLKILGIATDKSSEHELYGVVEPNREKINVGATGVGTMVTMKDSEGGNLVRMILGKQVPDKDELRYVRKPGQDRVYTVKVDTSKLSTKFEDWIEKDLLKLDAPEIQRVILNDYAIVTVQDQTGRPGKAVQERSAMTFSFKDSKWNLEELKQPDKGQVLVKVDPAEDEEPNATTLNALKTALDDLKIVDVERKPDQLASDFKSEKGLQPPGRDAMESLVDHGFFLQAQKDNLQIFSDAGEVFVGMQDGVEYVLRFGTISGSGEADSDDEKKDGEEQKKEIGLNRYILVSTQFNSDLIPKPELKPLPSVEVKKPVEKTPVEKKADDKKEDTKEKDGATKEESSKEKSGEEKKESSEKKTSEENKESAADEKIRLDNERKMVEEENKKLQEEYEKKLKAGQENVRKLNYRFADWYFVISEDVYKKIHLSRDDVIKKKGDEMPAAGLPQGGGLPPGLKLPPNFNLPPTGK